MKSDSSKKTLSQPPDDQQDEPDRVNNTLRAYREMRARILDGRMVVDKNYLEQDLAEILGMSRTPVREALIRLADQRLVDVRPRHGARVVALSADEMSDIYEICADLEANAARRAAQRKLSAPHADALNDAMARMAAATTPQDFANWLTADADFHDTILDAAGNKRLTELVHGLMAQVFRVRHALLPGRASPTQSNQDHSDIVAAIKAGNSELAHRLAHAHRMRWRQVVVETLRKQARPV